MPWVRLADDFYDHPKVLAAGPLAGWLWACSLAYSNRYLTDGFVPSSAVRRLADVDDAFRLAARLVDVGLWEPSEGGYRIHDFGDYQPSRRAVLDEREKTTDRVKRWRDRQGNAVGSASGNGVSNAVGTPSPVPGPGPVNYPGPDPAVTPTPRPPSPQAGPGEGVRRGRRGRRATTETSAEPEALPPLAPPTSEDRDRLNLAREDMRGLMSPANWETLAAPLEVLGRDSAGALWVRAPPSSMSATRVLGTLRRALLDAGEPERTAGAVRVVEGYGGATATEA